MIRISTLLRVVEDKSIAAAKQLNAKAQPKVQTVRASTARGLIKLANAIS